VFGNVTGLAFAAPPTGPNQVWQFDFSEYETRAGGTWRVAGIADYYSKVEFGWHWSPTANQHDAIAAVELALAEAQRLLQGPTILEHLTDPDTGEIVPITLVTDNRRPFRSFHFGALIAARPERHVRTRVRTPGQNGARERAFESLKYERLYREPSTTPSTWSARPRPTGLSSTRSGRTRRCPGTARSTSTKAAPTRLITFPEPGTLPPP
jgi:transposase InsO family protein